MILVQCLAAAVLEQSGLRRCPTSRVWLSVFFLKEEIIIHENVVGFPVDLLSDYLNCFYIIFTFIMSLHKMGWPGRRARRVTLLIHKRKVKARIPWSPELVRCCERNCTICFRPFLLAGNSEVDDERAWSMRRWESALF